MRVTDEPFKGNTSEQKQEMHHRGIGPDVFFCHCIGKCPCVCQGNGGDPECCSLNINTDSLHSLISSSSSCHSSYLLSGSAAPAFHKGFFIFFHLLLYKKVSFRSTNWATIFVKQSAHSPDGLLLRQKEGGGSLLFAGGELADFAGCGDSFTWGVGRGWGSAFGFGLAVQRPPFCPIHTNWLGYSWTVVCVPLILIFFGHLS